MDALWNDALDGLVCRIDQTLQSCDGKFPHWGDPATGVWSTTDDGDWTGGAWIGMLWLASLLNQDYAQPAEDGLQRLRPRAQHRTAFKGFGFYYACALGDMLRSSATARAAGLECAASLSHQFDASLGLIPLGEAAEEGSLVGAFESSIDSLQASPLLMWAAERAPDPSLRNIARMHTKTVFENHLRPNGSVIQSSSLDPVTGVPVRHHTHKGYSDESTWARAQAWALLYAGAMAVWDEDNAEWIGYGTRVADWWLDNVPADGVAFWDFDDPEIPAAPRDTAATAIAISGLLKLSASMGEGARSARYSQYARTVVTELSLKYLTPTTQHDRRSAGILTGGCFSMKPQLRSIDITPTHDCELIFGSYFFMESLMVLTGRHQASTF